MKQMETWLSDGHVQRLVVVVTGLDSGETLERWQFNVAVEHGTSVPGAGPGADGRSKVSGKKSIRDIHNEIQAIVRQITASVSTIYNVQCTMYNMLLCRVSMMIISMIFSMISLFILFLFALVFMIIIILIGYR